MKKYLKSVLNKVINIGDTVASLNDNIKGVVLQVGVNDIIIEDEDGFERTYSKNELIVYDDRLSLDKSTSIKAQDKSRVVKKKPKQPVQVIDLHHSNSRVNPNRILETQINKFYLQINTAIRLKKPSIIFIHGVGQGILQNKIESILKKHKIPFTEASYTKYGYGAVEVFLSKATLLNQNR